MSSPFSGRTVLIRQAKDPFVSDVQYIAYSKATLDERGRLDMRKLGLRGIPGASFWRMQYWTGLLRTISAPAARIFAFPTSTAANAREACIRQGSDKEPPSNGFKDDEPLVVVAERLDVLNRSGLSRRHVEESRMTEECST